MNEDRYVYVRIQASTFETILSLTPTSKNRIERSIWNSGARVLFISILFRVRPSFHLIPSVHFIFFEFYRIASRLLFLSLFLSFVHAVLYPFSVSGRSIFCTPIFFFSRTLFVLSSFSIRLISPTFPATPHFLRNRFTFFLSSLSFSLSLLPAVPIIASYAVCFSMRHRPCYRFVSFCQRASFLFDFLALSHAHWWR